MGVKEGYMDVLQDRNDERCICVLGMKTLLVSLS